MDHEVTKNEFAVTSETRRERNTVNLTRHLSKLLEDEGSELTRRIFVRWHQSASASKRRREKESN